MLQIILICNSLNSISLQKLHVDLVYSFRWNTIVSLLKPKTNEHAIKKLRKDKKKYQHRKCRHPDQRGITSKGREEREERKEKRDRMQETEKKGRFVKVLVVLALLLLKKSRDGH